VIPAERTPDPRPGEAHGRLARGRDASGADTATRDAADHDTASGDAADRDTASQDAASRNTASRTASRDAADRDTASRDTAGLLFVAEMYGVQLDHLAAVLAVSPARARAIAATWRDQGYAESARLGPGAPWTWVTRSGLTACGLRYTAAPPALGRLAHIRAVTAVRLALESAPHYAAAGGYWRSERRLRARMGGRVGLREHLPDAEVHWPDGAPVAWAGECWAIEVELTAKTTARTEAIMRELLTRTGDYGVPTAQARAGAAAGVGPVQTAQPPRHARVIYVCAPAARPTVTRARAALGGPGARIEIRLLPPGAALPSPAPTGPTPTATTPTATTRARTPRRTPAPERPAGHPDLTRNK
jgi:hypothetical protein